MLAMWALAKNDVAVPEDMIEAALRYMMATQDRPVAGDTKRHPPPGPTN